MRTIISAAVIVITALLQIMGVELTIAEREGLINSLVIIGAALMVVYSRYEATRNLKTGGLLKPAPEAESPAATTKD
jgi:hypothetical protein